MFLRIAGLILFTLLSGSVVAQITEPKTPFQSNTQHASSPSSNPHGQMDYAANERQTLSSAPSSSFAISYRPQRPDTLQIRILNLPESSSAAVSNKRLWELPLKGYHFANPTTEAYKKAQPLYTAAFDSINAMLEGRRPMDLKRAVFLVENVLYGNKLKYADFCKQIDGKLRIVRQVLDREKLDKANSVAVNYAIQQLYIKPLAYTDKNGQPKVHLPLHYEFNDAFGHQNYSSQQVSKLLATGKGQCHSLPLLYLILAQELKADAQLAYSPNHSYIVFPDALGNYYNFECTSGIFPSYSFIMASGFVTREAVKNGVYLSPTTLKETIANTLTDLALQQFYQAGGIDDFQLKCAKRTLDFFPRDIMALMTVSNYQSAKAEAATCMAGWPLPKNIGKDPGLKKLYEERNALYDYMDDLGFVFMPDKDYLAWLKSLRGETTKKESGIIQKEITTKAKSKLD